MEKIKKKKLMELTSEEKGRILGGCYVDAWPPHRILINQLPMMVLVSGDNTDFVN